MSKKYLSKLKAIKNEMNGMIQIRYNHSGHFNTKYNSLIKGNLPINMPVMVDPVYLSKRVKKLESYFWEMNGMLGIDGVFIVLHGSMVDSFKQLIQAIPQNKD